MWEQGLNVLIGSRSRRRFSFATRVQQGHESSSLEPFAVNDIGVLLWAARRGQANASWRKALRTSVSGWRSRV